MDENRIWERFDKIDETLVSVQVLQARHAELHERNSDSLDEHIRRTSLAEQRIEHIERHVQRVSGIFWFISFIAAALGVVASMKGFIK